MPPLILGNIRNWDRYKARGIAWFMLRWIASRNITGGFCAILILAKLLTLIF